eukprot:4229814-Pleurochrysis_carterae.AAC.1
MAACTVLSSIHHFQRVSAPGSSSKTIKRFANIVTRKGGGSVSAGRRAHGLLERIRIAIHQRRFDPELEIKLLQQGNGVVFDTGIFEPVSTNVVTSGAYGSTQGSSSGDDGLSQEASARPAAAEASLDISKPQNTAEQQEPAT